VTIKKEKGKEKEKEKWQERGRDEVSEEGRVVRERYGEGERGREKVRRI
jgi:hypothetical protein